MNILREEFEITDQLNAYQYVKKIQDDFEYSIIPFSKEYYITLGIER